MVCEWMVCEIVSEGDDGWCDDHSEDDDGRCDGHAQLSQRRLISDKIRRLSQKSFVHVVAQPEVRTDKRFRSQHVFSVLPAHNPRKSWHAYV